MVNSEFMIRDEFRSFLIITALLLMVSIKPLHLMDHHSDDYHTHCIVCAQLNHSALEGVDEFSFEPTLPLEPKLFILEVVFINRFYQKTYSLRGPPQLS